MLPPRDITGRSLVPNLLSTQSRTMSANLTVFAFIQFHGFTKGKTMRAPLLAQTVSFMSRALLISQEPSPGKLIMTAFGSLTYSVAT